MGSAPALLIVDFVVGFADPAHFGGCNIVAAIAATVPLLAFARRQELKQEAVEATLSVTALDAAPLIRPLCALRNFVRFGCSMT